ncbi:MAG: acyl-CoA thioesterase [Bacteroidales bacterium]|nr:acyl-CoA thioesterase [Bacteroidales bacterium]
MGKELSVQKSFEVRFSEVDMMNVVWHGSYILYLEDAREAFGAQYGLSYHRYIEENIFAPLVEMKMNYRKPLRYGMHPVVKITYRPTQAAKIIFDYEIFDPQSGDVFLTATSTQVFMDRNYQLLWSSPEFYIEWQKAVGLL